MTYHVIICEITTGEVTHLQLSEKYSELFDQKLDEEDMDFEEFYNEYLYDKVGIDLSTTLWVISENFSFSSKIIE